jgi:hypothetical protein
MSDIDHRSGGHNGSMRNLEHPQGGDRLTGGLASRVAKGSVENDRNTNNGLGNSAFPR